VEQKVCYAGYLLTGPEATWWEELNYKWPKEDLITWNDFKQKFCEAFVVGSIPRRKGGEAPEKKGLKILKHVQEFNCFSSYISEEVKLEAKRQREFMRRLQGVMKMQMRIVHAKEFQELLDSTRILVGTDSEVSNGKEEEVMMELH
jgi:hypothetical protein